MGEVEWPRTMAISVILLTFTLACDRAGAGTVWRKKIFSFYFYQQKNIINDNKGKIKNGFRQGVKHDLKLNLVVRNHYETIFLLKSVYNLLPSLTK